MPGGPGVARATRGAVRRVPPAFHQRVVQRRVRRDDRPREGEERGRGRGARGGARLPRLPPRDPPARARARAADAVLGGHRPRAPGADPRAPRGRDRAELGVRGGPPVRRGGGEVRAGGAHVPRLPGDLDVAVARGADRKRDAEPRGRGPCGAGERCGGDARDRLGGLRALAAVAGLLPRPDLRGRDGVGGGGERGPRRHPCARPPRLPGRGACARDAGARPGRRPPRDRRDAEERERARADPALPGPAAGRGEARGADRGRAGAHAREHGADPAPARAGALPTGRRQAHRA